MKFHNDKPGITTSRDELLALQKFASADELRPNIHAIHFVPASRTVAATNGHALLLGTEVAKDELEPAPGSPATVSLKTVAAWLRFSSGTGDIVLSWDAAKITAHIDGQELRADVLGVRFPPWRLVIPKRPGKDAKVPHTLGFGASLVIDVLDALQCVAIHGRKTCIAWHFNGDWFGPPEARRPPEEQPAVLTVHGHDSHWRAIVMPMRYSDEEKIVPWRDAFPEPKKPEPKAEPAAARAAEEVAAEASRTKKAAKPPAKPRAKAKSTKTKRGRR